MTELLFEPVGGGGGGGEAAFRAAMLEAGFDIVAEAHTSWYNDFVEERKRAAAAAGTTVSELTPLPDVAGTGAGSRMLVIGNSKAMWPKFLQAMRGKLGEEEKEQQHPLDNYTVQVVRAALDCFPAGTSSAGAAGAAEVFFSHEYRDPARLVAFQRLAALSGLCHLDEDNSRLCIHPRFGPWFSLRALVVLPEPTPTVPLGGAAGGDAYSSSSSSSSSSSERVPLPAPALLPSPLSPDVQREARELFDRAVAPEPEAAEEGGGAGGAEKPPQWKKWLAVREAVGAAFREHRYSDEQVEYHYNTRGALLREAIDRREKRKSEGPSPS